MGALASKIESAARTQEMSKTMASTIPILQKAMKNMDSLGVSNIIVFILNFIYFRSVQIWQNLKNVLKIWK